MSVVLPKWLDQVQGIDYSPEKQILMELEEWAQQDGWVVSDGGSLPFDLMQRTDVLLEGADKSQRLRIAVLPKSKGSPGAIRIDASSIKVEVNHPIRTNASIHRIFELIYRPRVQRWRVETATVPLAQDFQEMGWVWFRKLAFDP